MADMQMLDRLSLNLVSLPPSTYDTVLLLTDADGSRAESQRLLSRQVISMLVTALKPGGILRSQDGKFGALDTERREIILAGLTLEHEGIAKKPESTTSASVPLKFGKSKSEGGAAATTVAVGTGVERLNTNGKRVNGDTNGYGPTPAGVGFVDFGDDLDIPMELNGEDSDDELIDEDTLLTEEDLTRRQIIPRECLFHPLCFIFIRHWLLIPRHLPLFPLALSAFLTYVFHTERHRVLILPSLPVSPQRVFLHLLTSPFLYQLQNASQKPSAAERAKTARAA